MTAPMEKMLSEFDELSDAKTRSERESGPKTPEHTLAAIRDIEKGLETNLRDYMKFLQVLSKDTRSTATAEWVSQEEGEGASKAAAETLAPPRPGTAPAFYMVLSNGASYDFDDNTVVWDGSGSGKKPPALAPPPGPGGAGARRVVASEVENLEWDAMSRSMPKPWSSMHVMPHGHGSCDPWDMRDMKREPMPFMLHSNGRVWTWSTEPISESQTPKSVLSSAGSHKEKVSVCVRMRPFNEHEKICPLRQVLCSQKDKVIVKDYNHLRHNHVTKSKEETLQFDVDYVLDDSFVPRRNWQRKEESQQRMFEILGKPCVENALDGVNTTIMAYGQMGSGKTYTMMGDGTHCGRGLVPRIVHELMHRVHEDRKSGLSFSIQVSYLEIYQEKVRDLLVEKKAEHVKDEEQGFNSTVKQAEPASADGRGSSFSFHGSGPLKKDYLRVREHPVTGPYVEGLIWKDVTTCGEMDKLVKQGAANRTLGNTNTHRFSSRGHTLFTIKLIRGHLVDELGGTTVSHINLVDLAGSEKMTTGQKPSAERTYESKYINRSLAQLNDVITNLSRSNKTFVSYRSSALTWLLRESLGGNSKTFLVASISPAEQDFQESVHTLRCAAKANRIHGVTPQGPDPKKQIFLKMNEEIRTLHYLIADLTKKSMDASKELRPGNRIMLDEADELCPTREMVCNKENIDGRNAVESIIQQRPPSRLQEAKAGSVEDDQYAYKQ